MNGKRVNVTLELKHLSVESGLLYSQPGTNVDMCSSWVLGVVSSCLPTRATSMSFAHITLGPSGVKKYSVIRLLAICFSLLPKLCFSLILKVILIFYWHIFILSAVLSSFVSYSRFHLMSLFLKFDGEQQRGLAGLSIPRDTILALKLLGKRFIRTLQWDIDEWNGCHWWWKLFTSAKGVWVGEMDFCCSKSRQPLVSTRSSGIMTWRRSQPCSCSVQYVSSDITRCAVAWSPILLPRNSNICSQHWTCWSKWIWLFNAPGLDTAKFLSYLPPRYLLRVSS